MSTETQSFNLAQSIYEKIEELGLDEAAKFFDRTKTVLQKWQGGTLQPDVTAAQKVLDAAMAEGLDLPVFAGAPPQSKPSAPMIEPEPEGTIADDMPKKHVKAPVDPVKLMERARKFSILCPINREMSYATVLSMLGQWKTTLPEEIRDMLAHMDFEPDTTPHMGRNRLAMRFLERGDEWSFWMDSDIIAPIGNPHWFRKRTGSKAEDKWLMRSALEKLTSRGKTLIGALYCERNDGRRILAKPVGGEKLDPQELRKGPQDRLVEVEWLGFGCVAVHRKVFEDILEKVPGVKSNDKEVPHQFFTPKDGGSQGEDMFFQKIARQAGHPTFLDLSVHCAHIGKTAHLP